MSGTPDRPLAVTMGEPSGIGGEISLRAWQTRRVDGPVFFVIDHPPRLTRIAGDLGWDVPVQPIESPSEANRVFARALPVLPLRMRCSSTAGRPSPNTAAAVLDSIDRAVDLARTGQAAAMVTNPIHKGVLLQAGFEHPGHTDYLAERAGVPGRGVMMLVVPGLRVVPVTVHIPLARVALALTAESIVAAGEVTALAMRRDFGIAAPRLAVAGLNPHAGEAGALGDEEDRVIVPAIDRLRERGIAVEGPSPADTLFHADARRRYDAVLCMYHDQALIPLKTIDFHRGVNVTLGLPFVRTSPDHGTALDIAGTGRADPRSLMAALDVAADMAARRHGEAGAA